jgi:hypothetical protein
MYSSQLRGLQGLRTQCRVYVLARLAVTCLVASSALTAQSVINPTMEAIVRYNAPYIVQETIDDGSVVHSLINHLLRVDFDNDLYGSDNALNLNAENLFYREPVVYYSIAETGDGPDVGFYYIGYYFYHGRDRGFNVGPAHDPYGILELAWSQAHGAMIPYADSTYIDMGATLGNGDPGHWGGKIHDYYDVDFAVNRPVVMEGLDTHATYVAQSCSGVDAGHPYSYYEPGGYDWAGSTSSILRFCLHDYAGHAILYVPAVDNSNPYLSNDYAVDGTYSYELLDMASGPMWQQRLNTGGLFTGDLLNLGHGVQGLGAFQPGDYNNCCANPPWFWQGGPGEPHGAFGYTGYWYYFSDEGTSSLTSWTGPWASWNYGTLLTDPQLAAYNDFPGYADWRGSSYTNFYVPQMVFNEFRPPDTAPVCCDLSAEINGPDILESGVPTAFSASASGGTPPYTYQWSGAADGTESSINVTIYSASDLYLDVWDAAGHHAALSTYLQVSCGGGIEC